MNGDEHSAEHDNPGDCAFPLQEPGGKRRKEKTHGPDRKRKKPNWKRRAFWTNAWIATFTGATVVVGAWQWSAMDSQLTSMQAANDTARIAAEAARTQAQTARLDMVLNQRPWLLPSQIEWDYQIPVDREFTIRWVWKNTGRTPAFTDYIVCTGQVMDRDVAFAPDEILIADLLKRPKRAMVGPEQPINIDVPVGPFDARYTTWIATGEAILYGYCRATYRDVFDDAVRSVEACFQFDPAHQAAGICATHNHAD